MIQITEKSAAMLAIVNQVSQPNSERNGITCRFMMLIFRIPCSTPEMNVECRPALSVSCSCVNPSVSRRMRIVWAQRFSVR